MDIEKEKENSEIYTTESKNGFMGELVLHNEKLKQIQKMNP